VRKSRLVVEEGHRFSAFRLDFSIDNVAAVHAELKCMTSALGLGLWKIDSPDSPRASDPVAIVPPSEASAPCLWIIAGPDEGSLEIVATAEVEAEASRGASIAALWLARHGFVYPRATRWTVRGTSYPRVVAEVSRQIRSAGGVVDEGFAGHETLTFRLEPTEPPSPGSFTIEVSEHPGDATIRLVAHQSPSGLRMGWAVMERVLDALATEAVDHSQSGK
jgi:hypothetical protein